MVRSLGSVIPMDTALMSLNPNLSLCKWAIQEAPLLNRNGCSMASSKEERRANEYTVRPELSSEAVAGREAFNTKSYLRWQSCEKEPAKVA